MKLRMNQIALFLVFTMTAFDQAVGGGMPSSSFDMQKGGYFIIGFIIILIAILAIKIIWDIMF